MILFLHSGLCACWYDNLPKMNMQPLQPVVAPYLPMSDCVMWNACVIDPLFSIILLLSRMIFLASSTSSPH